MSTKLLTIAAVTGNRSVAEVPPVSANTATFSPCRKYRYSLWRRWGDPAAGYALFVGLNPSTADEEKDDPTIRRCVSFAKAWGYSGLCMTNLFAFRATDPDDMKAAPEPIGADTDKVLLNLAKNAGVVVAAWGVNGTFQGRDAEVLTLLPAMSCLRLTKDGHPGHPLYLPQSLKPIPMQARNACLSGTLG